MYTLIAFILDSMRNKKERYLSCNLHTGAPSDFLRVICHSVRCELSGVMYCEHEWQDSIGTSSRDG